MILVKILAVFVAVIVAGMVTAAQQSAIRRKEDRWAQVGEEFGFVRDPESPTPGIVRKRGGTAIWVSRQQADKQREKTRMKVAIYGPGPATKFIRLRGEEHGLFSHNPNAEDVVVGDPDFDKAFVVTGPVPLLQAVLTPRCRAQLLTVRRQGGATLEQGQLSYSVPCDDGDAVRERMRQALQLARSLRIKESEIPDRLVQNASGKDLPRVRVRNLEALAKLPDSNDRAVALALKLLGDRNPEMRLQVALRLGAKELEPLLALADRERDKYARAGLLSHLAKFAGQRLWPTIKQALRSRDEIVQRAAADAACATGYKALAPRIARKLARQMPTAGSDTLVTLTDSLRVLRDPATEGVLVQLLAHESRDVQRAAAVALGEFGSVAAVEPLLECKDKLLLGGDTKTAILHAVERIQSRIGHVELGALSLAESTEHAGALSLAVEDDQDGALSLVDSTRERKPG